MLGWALTFLLLALLAAFLGFGETAFVFNGLAKIVFVVFLLLFVVSVVARAARAS